MSTANTFCAWLRSRRREVGLTQKALGQRIGKNQSLVGDWERGACQPSAPIIPALAAVLQVTTKELVAAMGEPAVAVKQPA